MDILGNLKKHLTTELESILNYWKNNTIDNKYGGFIGHIDYPDIKKLKMNKGIILNSRILWTFSAASNFYKDNRYADLCERSFSYLKDFFRDNEEGGVFWEVDYKGAPINKRKQIYAQAFTIYALSEYYLFSKNEEAKSWAIEIFETIENIALDTKYGGYIEAFNQNWNTIEDMRLSKKDDNAAKTMNTHLHILEAYTTLYKIYPIKKVQMALQNLLQIFTNKLLSHDGHFNLFFDEHWNLKSSIYSYGHDIETSWLLVEAAKTLNNEELLEKIENIAILVVNTFVNEAIDDKDGVMNEIDITTGNIDTDRHWWPQAEAIVGLYNAYRITKKDKYLDIAFKIWKFTNTYIIDHKYGEWHWLVDKNGKYNPQHEKVGMWKCPYHNSRACIQIIK
ncbi:AGE family epimerase/isomerase [Aquimarina algiphila]|uniref:AGE family epimerase/isomerase n=1 Tax=Aquimarina algiphila TaxID=2047982 RepID=UPI002492201F|nr:AGE family epimerase/isomerase [Aquimarina algiphila]